MLKRASVQPTPSNPRRTGLAALDCAPGREYDEDAFLYFLSVERARAHQSSRPLRLLVATVEHDPGRPAAMRKRIASKLFAGLHYALRETDIIGWFRQGRVAAAILSEHADAAASERVKVIQQRVGEGLRQRLPAGVAQRLRTRVIQLPRQERIR